MTIAHLKVFRDIARSQSVSRAADLNRISQSAVSQTLKTLERQLGLDLVDRTTRPLKLTPAGEIFLEASREIVRRYEQVEAQLESFKTVLRGSVNVASIYSIGLYEMTQFRERFEQRYPETNIHLEFMRPDKIYQALQEDRADIGLVSYPTPMKGLRTIPWRNEKMVLVCHRDHALARKGAIPTEDLSRTDFISFDAGLSIRSAIDKFLREHGVQREVALEFDNIQMIKEALSINQGVSILPERTVLQEVADGRLVTRSIEGGGPVRPVGIVLNRKKRFSPAAEAFLEFLQGGGAAAEEAA